MSTAAEMYATSLNQTVDVLKVVGPLRTVLVQGHMGTGKSSLLKILAEELPTHTPCYFDCTTKDLGDITIPKLNVLEGEDYVTYAVNEELGMHLNKPIILMIDEYGKSNPAVKTALARPMLERKLGSYTLHPDSIVFATTNLGAEGVGDLIPAHGRNRLIVIKMRKSTNMEFIEWGVSNGIEHSILGWSKDNPQAFASFEDVKDPEENPYIYHPSAPRASFVTPRSLEAASDILKAGRAAELSEASIIACLMGTIGDRAAMDLMAFVKLADQLPSLDSIKTDPKNAKVPDSAAAVCMVVYRTLASLDKEWINAWMDYMPRLDKEAQGMFANGVRAPKYSKQSLVMTNRKFTEWALQNNYMFAADKK
jgi:energy-coupling factor transporter ATP-binding protein EcfA2